MVSEFLFQLCSVQYYATVPSFLYAFIRVFWGWGLAQIFSGDTRSATQETQANTLVFKLCIQTKAFRLIAKSLTFTH